MINRSDAGGQPLGRMGGLRLSGPAFVDDGKAESLQANCPEPSSRRDDFRNPRTTTTTTAAAHVADRGPLPERALRGSPTSKQETPFAIHNSGRAEVFGVCACHRVRPDLSTWGGICRQAESPSILSRPRARRLCRNRTSWH